MQKLFLLLILAGTIVLSGCVSVSDTRYNACKTDSDCVLADVVFSSNPDMLPFQTCINVNEQKQFTSVELVNDSDSKCVCSAPPLGICTGKAADWTQCNTDNDCKKITWNYKWNPAGAVNSCTIDPAKYLADFDLNSIEYTIGDSSGCTCLHSAINSSCELK